MVLGSESLSTLTSPRVDDLADLPLYRAETGGLFRMGIKLMMAKSASNMFVPLSAFFCLFATPARARLTFTSGSARCNSDFVPLVNLISILFQIRDDYMNLQSTEVRRRVSVHRPVRPR